MDGSNSTEIQFHVQGDDFEWKDPNNPKDIKGWKEKGEKYYERYLQPVLPGLESLLFTLQEENSVPDEETACIFLDRDSRPAMQAWRERTKQRKLKTFPLPLSGIQVHDSDRTTYSLFAESEMDRIDDPDEWSRQLATRYDQTYQYNNRMQTWVAAFKESHGEKLKNTKLIALVDIGYHGSILEIARYLLEKAFPDKIVRTVLLYKYSDKIPIRAVVSNETTWYAESSIPQTTVGYSLKGDRYNYLKAAPDEADYNAEAAFYRGVIHAASVGTDLSTDHQTSEKVEV